MNSGAVSSSTESFTAASPSRILRSLFDSALELRYCVLRSRTSPPGSSDDELDVLVDPDHIARFRDAARSSGFHLVPGPHGGDTLDRDHRFFYGREEHTDHRLTLDVTTGLYFDPNGGRSHRFTLTGLAEAVLAERVRRHRRFESGGTAGEFAALLHEAINRGGRRPDRLMDAVRRLAERHRAGELPDSTPFLDRRTRDAIVPPILEADEAGDVDEASVRTLRSALLRLLYRQTAARPFAYLGRRLRTYVDRIWHRRLARPVACVALAGPDGVGKSTATRAIVERTRLPRVRIRRRYFGRARTFTTRSIARVFKLAYFLVELVRVLADRPFEFPDGKLVRDCSFLAHLRLKLLQLSAICHLHRWQGPFLGEIVLLDRSILDEYARIHRGRLRRRGRALLRRAGFGTERACVLLHDRPEAIRRRSGERTCGELRARMRRQRIASVELAPIRPTETVAVDGRPLEDVVDEVETLLLERCEIWLRENTLQ